MKQVAFPSAAVLAITAFLMALFVLGAPNQATAQGADDPGQVDAGKLVYESSCAGCHGDDGSGVAGRGRPLTGIASQGDRATHVASITDGKGGMPAFGSRLSEAEIDEATSYVRLTFVEAPAAAAETELAVTGVGSTELAVIGGALVLGGAQLVVWARRKEDQAA